MRNIEVRLESVESNVAEGSLSVRLCADEHGTITRVHVCCASVVRTTGNLCFVACAPSAWGLHGARARQLEAQSVEGVHYSVVGGRPDPRRHPDHLPLALSSDQDVVPDSSAQPNPLDTFWRGREGGRRLERCGRRGGTNCREGALMTRQQKRQRSAGTLPTSGRSN